jgi:hypothetical protein
MLKLVGGYTLLEVMLFLAISSIFLAISNVVLQGQTAHTEFVASMNDAASKMQQWVDQVKNGYSASSASATAALGNYNCTLDASGNPVLVSPGAAVAGNGTGSNLDCVFLGKAIMVNDKLGAGPKDLNNKIYAYTVLGRRTYDDGTGQVLVNNIKNAKSTAAVFPVGSLNPTINLTEVYKIPNGTRVRHVSPSNLAGFFADTKSANNSVLAAQYPLNTNVNPTDWASTAWTIARCINLSLPGICDNTPATPENLWPIKGVPNDWKICFESTRNDERALLHIISSNGSGAAVKLEMGKTGLCS